ncbi:MAG: serine/threonine protein kinase [Gemmatimonadaceae bacterium]|nr:serine/threonine protein kinase [Gemmatimonadaceae bacterium]MCC6429330.1 serine/threonine protein kinase [Gemmatimonadaceae bacterium]
MATQPLTPERFARLQEGFERALELETASRADFLCALDAEDADLGQRLRGLLDAHAQTSRGFESPLSLDFAMDDGVDRWIGRRVGVYDIRRRIGVGGMGAVYEGVRNDDQFRKRVAIKLLRAQTVSESAVRRFRRERQILATLEHPHIAVLMDGGVTPDGHPFFAMEYVEGEPLTTYCDARTLPISARLELFRQVCAAVQFAHQNLVVHRDLKPQNILVNADGQVKLLDFGIASLLPSALDGAEDETLTRDGARALTPGYASPEQLLGRPIGTRSDVYSLGIVLYELLCGKRPFEVRETWRPDGERIVRTDTPARPSTAITAERLGRLSERSGDRVRARLAGDLDAIVLKALRTEPERRYGSAGELSADILNHLTGMPVSARPDSLGYRVGKLLRRRRVESLAVALTLFSMVTGSVVALRQARVADREKVRAQTEGERASEVTRFLTTMLGAANPGAFGRNVTVREVLDSAVLKANSVSARPALESEIRRIIGGTFLSLGEFPLAEAQYRLAVDAEGRQAPAGGRGTAVALSALSMAKEFEGEFAAADSLLRIADTLFARHGFDHNEQRISHLDARGRILNHLGNSQDAEPILAEALQLLRGQRPVNDSSLAASYTNLAVIQSDLGNNRSAETLMVTAVAAARRAYGTSHPHVAAILSPLASVQDRAGLPARAESTFRETISMRRKWLGDEHPDLAWSMFNLADFLLSAKRYAESAEWSRRVLVLRGNTLKDEHPIVSGSMSLLGRALDGLDSLDAGERWLRESLAVRKTVYPPGHFLIASSEGQIGAHLTLRGEYARAESMLVESERKLVAARGDAAPIVKDARTRLVTLYERWGKADSVQVWRARMERAAKGS